MRKQSLALAALLMISCSWPAFSATTADDAAKLKASLQTYFGASADAVTITPDGDGFKVVIDASAMLEKSKADVTVSPLDFQLTPEGAGKWKVTRDGALTFEAKSKDDFALTEKADNYSLNAEYDEQLAVFTTMDVKVTNLTFEEAIKDAKAGDVKISGKFESAAATATGTANAAGGVDVKFTETFGPGEFTSDMSGGEAPQPIHVSAKLAGGQFDGTVTGAKSAAFLQLFKFFGAHPEKTIAAADQDTLKGLLRDALPVFANMDASGSFTGLSAETPLGQFKAAKFGVGLKANGAVKEGKFEETLSVEGLELPAGLVPSWATALVTKNVGLGVQVAGYDLETFLKAEIDAADFTKETPVDKETEEKNAQLLLPKGTVDVTLTQYDMNNDTYAVKATGTMQAGPAAQPTGQAHISIKGIDDIMKVAQAAPPEAGLQQMSAVIVVAKGLAKAEADGALGWDIAATPDGKITVNGIDVNSLKQ